MLSDRIRGGAGFVFAALGLLLLRGAPGFSEISAASGCQEGDTCRVEVHEEGVYGGPNGTFSSSYTATCTGNCSNGGSCLPFSENGSGTYTCSCDIVGTPSKCAGFVTVDNKGKVLEFTCSGDCGTLNCKVHKYNEQRDDNCPTGYSNDLKCVCE